MLNAEHKITVEASRKVISLVKKGDVCDCRSGVAWFVVTDDLDALPHALGVRVRKVFLYL